MPVAALSDFQGITFALFFVYIDIVHWTGNDPSPCSHNDDDDSLLGIEAITKPTKQKSHLAIFLAERFGSPAKFRHWSTFTPPHRHLLSALEGTRVWKLAQGWASFVGHCRANSSRPPTQMNSADVTSHGLPPWREYCNLKRLLENRVVQHFLAWELLQAAL